MQALEYAKSWIKRPYFYNDQDKAILSELISIIETQNAYFDNPVAFAKINERGDLFDLRLQANPYTTNLYPLYLRFYR